MKFSLMLATLLALPLSTFAADGLVATEDSSLEVDVPFSQSSVQISLRKAEAKQEEKAEEQEVGKVYKPKVLYFSGQAQVSPHTGYAYGSLAAVEKLNGPFNPQYRRANAMGDIVELETKDGMARVRVTLGEPTKVSLDLYAAGQIAGVHLNGALLHSGQIQSSVQLVTASGGALAL